MAVVSIATLKTYFETGDFPSQSQFVDLIDTLDNASTSTYKKYVAVLTQTGANAPVATVLENTLGGTIVWTRNDVGDYNGTLASAFTANKTILFTSPINDGSVSPTVSVFGASLMYLTANIVQLYTTDSAGLLSDGIITPGLPLSIEIRVYP